MRENFPLSDADRQFIYSVLHDPEYEEHRRLGVGVLTFHAITLGVGEHVVRQLHLFEGMPADWHDWLLIYEGKWWVGTEIALGVSWHHALESFGGLVGFGPVGPERDAS
jgi:hypothetical protein